MRGKSSVPLRIRRLDARQYVRERDRAITETAAAFGIDEAELRAEVLAWEERTRRYGPETVDQLLARTAAELGISEAELRAEYEAEQVAHGSAP